MKVHIIINMRKKHAQKYKLFCGVHVNLCVYLFKVGTHPEIYIYIYITEQRMAIKHFECK